MATSSKNGARLPPTLAWPTEEDHEIMSKIPETARKSYRTADWVAANQMLDNVKYPSTPREMRLAFFGVIQ